MEKQGEYKEVSPDLIITNNVPEFEMANYGLEIVGSKIIQKSKERDSLDTVYDFSPSIKTIFEDKKQGLVVKRFEEVSSVELKYVDASKLLENNRKHGSSNYIELIINFKKHPQKVIDIIR